MPCIPACVTRKRWPDGVGEDGDHPGVFFAKNLPKGTPEWVRRHTIEHSGGSNDYPIANDIATLVWLAQLAALELHVPQWRFTDDGSPLPPDRLVLDLDPGEGVSLPACAEVAGWVREVLDGAGLTSYPVTSGSKENKPAMTHSGNPPARRNASKTSSQSTTAA